MKTPQESPRLIWECDSTQAFLASRLDSALGQRTGKKGAFAKAIGVSPSLVSQVLQGHLQLTLEQGEKASGFFEMGADETHYFLLMISEERAGTPSLKRYFQSQRRELLNRRNAISTRVGPAGKLSVEDQAFYYSTPLPILVHMALAIPEYSQSVGKISRVLGISAARLQEILDLLQRLGLVELNPQGAYQIRVGHIHLAHDSPWLAQHHRNLRLESLKHLSDFTSSDALSPQSLHYSSVFTASKQDLPRIREIFLAAIEEARKVIRSSPEENLFCYTVDLWGMDGQ